jgi:hypothetical protein
MNTEMKENIVSELAQTLGARVRKINFRDPNVFEREHGGNEEIENLSFREAVRFECERLKAEIKGNRSYLVLEVKADLNAGAWSVNEPDQITLARKRNNVFPLVAGKPLFFAEAGPSSRAREIVVSEAFSRLLEELDLGRCESVHFYGNALCTMPDQSMPRSS